MLMSVHVDTANDHIHKIVESLMVQSPLAFHQVLSLGDSSQIVHHLSFVSAWEITELSFELSDTRCQHFQHLLELKLSWMNEEIGAQTLADGLMTTRIFPLLNPLEIGLYMAASPLSEVAAASLYYQASGIHHIGVDYTPEEFTEIQSTLLKKIIEDLNLATTN